MTHVGHRSLARRLAYIDEQLDALEGYRALSPEVLLASEEKLLAVERLLERAIQGSIDCGRMLAGEEGWTVEDEDIFGILADRGVVAQDLASRLSQARGFRNKLAHEYFDIDEGKVIRYLHEGLNDLRAFSKCIVGWTTR